MNSCRCWSENRHESSWNWLYLIFIDWFTRYVDTGEDYIYIWFHMNLIWFRLISNIIEREIFFESIFICFFLWIEKMHCLRKGHLNPSKNLFFFERFRKYNQNQKSHLNLNFSDGRWIQKMYSLPKGHLNLNFSDGFRNCIPGRKAIWIHLNLNFSDGFRNCIPGRKAIWIHLNLNFSNGLRKCIS